MKQAVDLIFPKNLVQSPLICEMSRQVPVTFNIRRAKVNEKVGEIVLELEGSEKDLAAAVKWLSEKGVSVKPVTHDTVEG